MDAVPAQCRDIYTPALLATGALAPAICLLPLVGAVAGYVAAAVALSCRGKIYTACQPVSFPSEQQAESSLTSPPRTPKTAQQQQRRALLGDVSKRHRTSG